MTKREAKRAGWEVSKAVDSVYAGSGVEPDKKYTANAVLRLGEAKVCLRAYGRTKRQAMACVLEFIDRIEQTKAEGRTS